MENAKGTGRGRRVGAWVLMVGAMAACSSDESPPVVPDVVVPNDGESKPERVLPQIVWTAPAHGEADVWVRSPIQVTFSEPVSWTGAPVELSVDGVLVPTTVEYDHAKRTMTIKPNTPLAGPAQVSVAFGDIRGALGRPLVRPPWSWTLPTWVTVGETLKSLGMQPALAVGPGDRITVAFHANVASAPLQVYTIEGPKGTWRALPETPERARRPFTLLVGRGGRIVLVFVDDEGMVILREWVEDTGWRHLVEPRRTNSGVAIAAMDAQGMVFLAYQREQVEEANADILVEAFEYRFGNSRLIGTSVNDPVTEIHAELESLTLDRNGNPYIGYRTASRDARVRAWSYTKWVPLGANINPEHEDAGDTRIALDDAGTVYVYTNLLDRYIPRSRRQIFAFDGTKWVERGKPLSRDGVLWDPFFGSAGGEHMLAYLPIRNLELETTWHSLFDVSSTGWREFPGPEVRSGPVDSGNATIDANGVPVVAWAEGFDEYFEVNVARLNRWSRDGAAVRLGETEE